jgi:ABC-type antimicrobial peptide transport system permease subunit
MSILKFILRSLKYYRKQHLALFAATLLSTAVLTGALVVGDSVKFSLEELVRKRLGKTEFALAAHDRFFETRLAKDISSQGQVNAAPLLLLLGMAINNETNSRINEVQVVGIDPTFGRFFEIPFPDLQPNEAIVSENTANILNLKAGETFLLRVEKANLIPLNAPFVSDENSAIAMRLKVKAIATDSQAGRFSLNSNQTAPFNVFLPMDFLSEKLGLPGLANLIVVAGDDASLNTQKLDEILNQSWQLADAGLKIRDLNQEGKFEMLSDRIFIDKPISEAIEKLDLHQESVLTYLVNAIRFNHKSIPYSFVSALSGNPFQESLSKNEIIINEWLAEDLGLKTGDSVTLDYFVMGPMRKLAEKSRRFVVKNIIPIQGEFINESLMPLFPGISEAANCSDWETGIPIDLKKIRDKDEDYWNRFKGTPKAIVSMEAGREMWDNTFGNQTAIRFNTSDISQEKLSEKIIKNLDPASLGFVFTPVLQDGLHAAENAVDFGGLFLSLSFFVIAAGILLLVLIYSLNTETRSRETGVLAALGFNSRQIVRIRFSESVVTAIIGGIAGVGAGILYNLALLKGLNSVWQGAVQTNMLQVFIQPVTLFISALAGIILALLSVFLITRRKLKQPLTNLIKINLADISKFTSKKISRNIIAGIFTISAALLMVAYSLFFDKEVNAGMFLPAGALIMIGSYAFINLLISRHGGHKFVKNPDIFKLAMKYVSRNKNRSLAAIILLSIGTFSIIITAANRKTFYGTENRATSGTGGYQFWAQTTIPILFDLNTETGKSKVNLEDEPLFSDVKFVQFHKLDGDDASCLNLNSVRQPVILGVDPSGFQKKEAFSFTNILAGIEKKQVWKSLDKPFASGIIPAIADQTVLTWGLKKSIGDTLFYIDESGKPLKLLLIAGLENSIFQGNLLISDSLFRVYFPSVSGSKIMLVQANDSVKNEVSELLKSTFVDYGIEITSASERLAQFNVVTNTYLTVFMMLGGLGVLIGTIGLGIVLLRNILERKNELALLLALGYRKSQIFKIIFLENLFILIAGLTIGILGAVTGILPSLVSPSFSYSPVPPLVMILMVLITGIAAIFFPTRSALKKNLIESLKNE